jgi:hypothetical protein
LPQCIAGIKVAFPVAGWTAGKSTAKGAKTTRFVAVSK